MWRRFAGNLDQRQLALDARIVGQVTHFADLDDLVELLGDLLDGRTRPVDDHGQTHDPGFVGPPDGQALDGERALAEEAQHAVENDGALLNRCNQGVFTHRSLASFGLGTAPTSTRSRTAS